MAATLGSKAAGSIVNFPVNGVSRDFLVVHQGKPSPLYDDGFSDGTILLMKDIFENRQWNSSDSNDYANSTIHNYLNNEFLALIDFNIRAKIKQVKIPYRPGTSGATINSGPNGLQAYAWLLGGYEVNWTTSTSPIFPVDGATLAYFAGTAEADAKRIGYLGGTATIWWLRSPSNNNATGVWHVYTDGRNYTRNASYSHGIRPALVLPSSLLVGDMGEILTNQPPATPPGINVPITAISTQQITVSWNASTDPDGDLITYVLERSANGGAYVQIVNAAATNYSEIVLAEWDTIAYRVKATDGFGNESGYTTSDTVTVIHNQPPVISGEDGDLGERTGSFTYDYTVSDAESNAITVTESVGGTIIRTFDALQGVQNQVEVGGNALLVLLPDAQHTLKIEAVDATGNRSVRLLTFTKKVEGLFVAIDPISTEDQPYRAVVTVYRQAPAGSMLKVEATNNPYDATPAWEDCTNAVLSNFAHVFTNNVSASPQYGVGVRASLVRGQAIGECNISGIEVRFD